MSTQAFGSAVSVVFLLLDRQLSGKSNFTTNRNFSFCGANDCQDPNITLANIEQYTPAFVATRYSLIAFLAGLILIAVILYRVNLPVEAGHEVDQTINTSLERIIKLPSVGDDEATIQKMSSETSLKVIAKSLKSTLKLLITSKHLLIMWLTIYGGMTLSFFNGEITRAFVSCVLGVDKVGGKVNSKHGRNYPFAFAFVLDISSYVVCLDWRITENTTWVIYILSFMFGMSDTIWQSQTNDWSFEECLKALQRHLEQFRA
ncbi:protein unc-93 homolog A-like [Clavelina lepadiformis]|uniref:protein unc-93 homolog A-like n=1 Tax=Clavelina lepadiformis TaxID=159417 RepID=UPI0040436F8F